MTETNPFIKFWNAGYRRLVPIVPPDAKPSEKSTLARRPGALGKAVGVQGRDGLWRGYDWLRAPDTTLQDLDAWHAMGAGVGIRTGGGLIALDIDTLSPEHAADIHRAAVETWGETCSRIGRWPKRLLVYRCSEPVSYQRVVFDDGLEHKAGAEARVELLSDERQFVAHGIHPSTNRPYAWPGGLTPYDDLPVVTLLQVKELFSRFLADLPAAKHDAQSTGSADRAAIDQGALRAPLDAVSRAVEALPNTTALYPTYDDYVRVGYAIKGACQDDEATGLALYQEWAAKWEGGNDPEQVEADWRRMRPPFEIGAQWLFNEAERHSGGAFQASSTWFDPQPEPAGNPFEEAARDGNSPDEREPIKWLRPSAWAGIEPPAREWEVEGWIPRYEVTLLYGDGGIGKTLLAHQYATAAAAGLPWLGQATRQAKIMCFFCEDSEDELHRRQIDICRSLGVDLAALDGNLRIASRKYMNNILALWDRNSGAMRRQTVWEQLRADAVEFGAEVIIVDTLADTFGGSEIDRSQVNAFMKSCLGRLAQKIGGSLIALGHPSVAGKSEGRSGSTAWSNAARSRIFLRYPKGVEKGNVRELEGMKLNYGPKGALLKLKWDRGAFIAVAGSRPEIDLNAFKGAGSEPAALPDLADVTEAAVLRAVAEAAACGTALNMAVRSAAYAPKVLKRGWPELLADVAQGDVEAALLRLEKHGVIRAEIVGRREDRKPVMGYAVAAGTMGQTRSENDNLSAGEAYDADILS